MSEKTALIASEDGFAVNVTVIYIPDRALDCRYHLARNDIFPGFRIDSAASAFRVLVEYAVSVTEKLDARTCAGLDLFVVHGDHLPIPQRRTFPAVSRPKPPPRILSIRQYILPHGVESISLSLDADTRSKVWENSPVRVNDATRCV
ncbi:transposase [Klebsiella phage KPP2020]|uniref:Transposase n=1 Tax=Klebsiella phage KPP2020 TaxID=3017288 RepID=A0AAE9YF74_9CAUD|nr:transposase [Klebsiella phage KPP2020]